MASIRISKGLLRMFAVILISLLFIQVQGNICSSSNDPKIRRSDFPSDFIFGTCTAAAQVEGSNRAGGRGPSIWDDFIKNNPDKIVGRANNEIATDSYHRYKDDVKALKELGVDVYRFSISWTRILPIAKLYKDKFQKQQGGQAGVALVGVYYETYSSSPLEKAAAKRALDFELGWYMEPLIYGDYPSSMKRIVKDRLPKFTIEEQNALKGSSDFIGINYYTSRYAKSIPINMSVVPVSFVKDEFLDVLDNKDGVLIGPKVEGSFYINNYPRGLQKLLLFVRRKYESPKIYITENGFPETKNDSIPVDQALKDCDRISFIKHHLYHIHKAIKRGVNVKGYMYWGLLDEFEWTEGYRPRFGLYYTDYENNLQRIPKESAKWYHDLIKDNGTSTCE
ncbi:hypothetical protein ACFE04_014550 [Oxalis oulophora]